MVPRLVERSLSSEPIDRLRAEACAGLTGRVLEIGFGSGMNTPFYPPELISVAAVEPSDLGWEMSAGRRAAAGIPIERVGLDGQRLEAADAAYHSVLVTFSLCTIPDPAAALAEARRVLLPGGSLHFLEHGLAPTERVRRWQRRMEPFQRRIAGGCHLTRDVPALVEAAGFEVAELRQEYVVGPAVARPWTYGTVGRALAVG